MSGGKRVPLSDAELLRTHLWAIQWLLFGILVLLAVLVGRS